MEPLWNTGEKLGGIVDVDLVRIQAAPPVAGSGLVPEGTEYLAAQSIIEWDSFGLEWNDLRNGFRHAPYRFPRVIDTAVVEDVNVIAPRRGARESVLDDVALVLYETDAMNDGL